MTFFHPRDSEHKPWIFLPSRIILDFMKHPAHRLRFPAFIVLLLMLFLLASCVSGGGTGSRGSLSDAMDKARDDYEGDRTVPARAPERPPRNEPRDPAPAPSRGDTGGTAPVVTELQGIWLGFRGGTAFDPTNDMETLFDGDVELGLDFEGRLDVNLYAGIKGVEAVPGSALDDYTKNSLVFFRAGMEARLLLLPDFPVMCPYLSAGIGGYSMFWTFQNALIDGSTGDLIEGDGVSGLLLSAGAGVYLLNLPSFRAGISVTPEIHLFDDVTLQDFSNDYYDYYGTVKWTGEISIRMGDS